MCKQHEETVADALINWVKLLAPLMINTHYFYRE